MPTKRETHPSDRRRAYLLSEQDREMLLLALMEMEEQLDEDGYSAIERDELQHKIAEARKSLRA